MSGDDGWVGVEGEPGLKVRFGPDARSGRLIVTGLLLDRPAVTAEMLRKIPIGRIEGDANLNTDAALDAFAEERDALAPLERTPEMTPEAFSALVAEHYKVWARCVPHPAAAMAAHAGVKPPTMHTWIREARLRGLLPLRSRGKAG